MNELLAASPQAQVAHGALGCMVSLNHVANRAPVPLVDVQIKELGQHRVRHIDTPNVPHGWEARLLYEETTQTLLCGDLFTQLGDPVALTNNDVVEPDSQAEDVFGPTCLTPRTGPTIRSLAEFAPGTLAVMHDSFFAGDGAKALVNLADEYDKRLARAMK